MNKHLPDAAAAGVSRLAADLRLVIGTLNRRLHGEAGPGDFTWAQLSVLGRLEREGCATVTSLARAAGVRPQSMGATVSALTAAGLVSAAPDPNDGRQTILSITSACREMIKADRVAREDWLLRAIRTKLASDEQTHLAIGVQLLMRLVDS